MKPLNLILVFTIFLLVGCTKNETRLSECVTSVLKENNMTIYNGQEIGCKFFLEEFHYQNQQFFLLGNHCADIVSYPVDCAGNSLCKSGVNSTCQDFYENAQQIGIIGIEE